MLRRRLPPVVVALLAGAWLLVFTACGAAEPVTIERIDRSELPLRGVVARIDLSDSRVQVVTPPAGPPPSPPAPPFVTTLQTVSEVLRREGLVVAVNGDFFTVANPTDRRRPYVVGVPAMPLGPAAHGGKPLRSGGRSSAHCLAVYRDGGVRILPAASPDLRGAVELVSGNRLLVKDGQPQLKHSDDEGRAPRTAAALTADGRTLLLLVLDGRSIRSRGATLGETAALLVELGAHTALNLDGGGSAVMVRRGEDGQPDRLTTPSDGDERPIANVLGVRLLPSPEHP